MADKTLVGFGFGPIQTGLILLEAQASGNFGRYVIAEIDAALVAAVRANGNRIAVNVAHADRIEARELADLELLNPRDENDRRRIVEAIATSDELATAIPSVAFYESGGDASIVSLLAAGLTADRPRVLYACENHNYAAEILEEALRKAAPAERLARLRIVNTVVGKMSGVVQTPEALARLGLTAMVKGGSRAVLVEAFNRILISRVDLPGFRRGIEVFEEKTDLLPFEEAKLYGHNAIHALLGYLAHERGYRVMSEAARDGALMRLGREAFIEESGAALIRKHGALGDPLFTPAGYARYADDLLARMTNPFLRDEVERVCRDPKRKLGYGDRLVGAMREALRQAIRPTRLARGVAAALRFAVATGQIAPPTGGTPGGTLPSCAVPGLLAALWEKEPSDEFRDVCIGLVADAVADRTAN